MTENQGNSDSVNLNSMIVSLEYILHQIVSLSNFGKWQRLSITALPKYNHKIKRGRARESHLQNLFDSEKHEE